MKLKSRAFSIAVTVIFIAGVVLVNIFAGLLSERFFLKIDLSGTGLFTMSKETEQLLKNLSDDITLTVVADEADYDTKFKMIHEILTNYVSTANGRITLTFLDPNLNPNLKNKYSLTNFQAYGIIVESPRRYTSIVWEDLFTWTTDEYGEQSISDVSVETKMASALLMVQSDSVPKVVFTEGHQEPDVASFKKIFTNNSYVVDTINLLTDEFPEDATVLVSVSPQRDFMQSELEKIDAFMEGGGNFIFLNDIQPLRLKNVELFLYEWGLAQADFLVLDPTMCYQDVRNIYAQVQKPDVAYMEGLSGADTTDKYILNMYARPLSFIWPGGEQSFGRTVPLLVSYTSSYAKAVGEGGVESITSAQKESGDETGPFTLAALSQKTFFDDRGNSFTSNLILANVSLVNDYILDENYQYSSVFYNSQFLSYIVSDLNPASAGTLEIASKKFPGGLMLVDGNKQLVVFVVTVVLIPLLILAGGVLMWVRRKNL